MTSSFSWLDYSDRDRRKMLEVMDLFREKDTRDELGIGGVRDAFADLLFPGTSTIQTRARYFLFVPWIYLGVERSSSSRPKSDVARSRELNLIDALIAGEEKDGVIGRRAKQTLKRLPSSVYWQGLRVWGIRRFFGQQDQYFRSIKRSANVVANTLTEADWAEEPISNGNWHPDLPLVPQDFLKETTFALNREEATFLHDCINTHHSNSLLAWLVRCGKPNTWCDFPWEHPQQTSFDQPHQVQLHHAKLFSVAMWGAAVLYNLLLAQKIDSNEKISLYKEKLKEWSEEIDAMQGDLKTWQRTDFWQLAISVNPRISSMTKAFVEEWISLTLSKTRANDVINLQAAHDLIIKRERLLKRNQARFDNTRALNLWFSNGAAAGIGRIDFRWRQVQTIVNDILEGLER